MTGKQIILEFGEIAELRKEKFDPEKNQTSRECIELEHLEQSTGRLLGSVNSSSQKSSKNVFYKGDILFGKLRPYLKKYWLAEFDGVCSSEIWVLIPKKNRTTQRYLFYLIQSDQFVQAANVSSGSKMPRADWNFIINCPLSIINSLEEQTAIANLLSTWDKAIETTQKLIAQKELRKKWLMQMLLTGKKRVKGFDKEWKEVHIRDVSKEVSLRNKEDKVVTVLSCTKYEGLVPSLEYFGRKLFANDLTTYKIVPINHFAYATNHIEEGSIGYQKSFEEALISPMYTVFKTDESINNYFLFRLLKSHRLIYEYNARMEGSIDRRGGLRWNVFSSIKIDLPSYEEQTAIAQILSSADKEILLLQSKLEKLKEQKKGLMQVLLTGKKRLIPE
ncbi:MAG: restriction endonuclease subunit S [Bacteroidota bacterium]